MRWYNTMDPGKVMNWDNLCWKFLYKYPYNIDLQITFCNVELIKQEKKEGFPK